MGHFDFVVTDRNHDPQFAIEFDGGGHNDKNDHLKDEICRQSGLALFRLTPNSSRVKIREAFFVATSLMSGSAAGVARMQAAGEIGPTSPL